MRIIDIHTHGGFGVNFNRADVEEIYKFAKKIKEHSYDAFCPTLASDTQENLHKALQNFSKYIKRGQDPDCAKVLGIHLECGFLNPEKKGTHAKEDLIEPNIENWFKHFKEFTDIIKIVTLAPELDKNQELQKYLISKGIKVQAGHTMAEDAGLCDGITHMFNAMPPLSHKKDNITSQALVDNNIFVEFIGDLIHTTKNMAKLLFGIKDKSKIMLVSDSLPIAHSGLDEIEFCNHKVFKNGKGEGGELAGSVKFLDEIAQNLIDKKIITEADADKMCYENQLKYLDLKGI